ncbi:MAG: ROK family protein [Acidimicrobiia bacterium]
MRTVGFDLGGTKLLGVVTDETGTVFGERRRPTLPRPEAALDEIVAMLGDLAEDAGEAPAQEPIAAVGVGIAGLVGLDGIVRHAPNLPGWDGLDAGSYLRDRIDVPVHVDNDATAAAFGELIHGVARDRRDVLVVTLGTGIGGGIVAGGVLQRGGSGLAGEIGHITIDRSGPRCACGAAGHWEALASGQALGRLGRGWAERGDAPEVLRLAGGSAEDVTGTHVGDAAQAGDSDALAIVGDFAGQVAVGLASLVNVLDPEMVVIGGGLSELGPVLLDPLAAACERRQLSGGRRPFPALVTAALGERAGAVGAAALARQPGGQRS